jgi:hypothetical protein
MIRIAEKAIRHDRWDLNRNVSVVPFGDDVHLIGKIPPGAMKVIIFVAASVVIIFGLIVLQLRSMKRYHPNAEFLIDVLKLIESSSDKNNNKDKRTISYG